MRQLILSILAACIAVVGCEKNVVPFHESAKVSDSINETDLLKVLSLLELHGDELKTRSPNPFPPLEVWGSDRSLRVLELLQNEREAITHSWQATTWIDRLPKSPSFLKSLEVRQLSPKQFVSLMLQIGLAYSREQVEAGINLETLEKTALRQLRSLETDARVFSQLTPAEAHAVTDTMIWFYIADRAHQLLRTGPIDAAMLEKHQSRLNKSLPAWATANPLTGLYPRAADFGVPFDEGNLSDADLRWTGTRVQ